ncbi:Ig-like domain-containing protein, partial [Tenacibaculum finnmarkense]|uniref:Ig-like domain-containing protein n=1 Tax=Tenacibaculum finnmarkense TaxID=2781243 RepID=UPI001E34908A
ILTETSTGRTNDATIRANYTETDPLADNDSNKTPGLPGDNVDVSLLTNDKLSDGTQAMLANTSIVLIDPATSLPSATPNVVIVAGEGTWTLDPLTGIVTFNPDAGFTQTPTDISYELTETSTGLSDIATVKAEYTEADPIATNDSSTGNVPGVNATVNLLTNDKLSDGTQATVSNTSIELIDLATGIATTTPNVVTVAGEGVWTLDPLTGNLTFNPEDGFTQTPTDISYELTETSTGLSDIATVKAEYTEADPIANNDSSTGNTPGDDATVKLLDNDDLSDGTQATVSNTSIELIDLATGIATTTPNVVTVAGEGVWTLDPLTGNLTFNPEDGFTQTPTDISYELTETSTGLSDIATVKAGYGEGNPIATNDTSTGNTPGDDVVVNLLDNDKLSDGTEITDPSTQVTIDLDPSTPGVQNTLVVPNQGTWTLDPLTGNLTFNPEDGFTQTPTDISYELTETSTGLSDIATVTVTVGDVIADDPSSTEIDTPVVVDIFENDSDIPTSGTISTTTPTNGTVEITDPNNTPNDPSDDVVTYVPNTDFTGTDTFDYTVCDNASTPNCQTATVTVTVGDVIADDPSSTEINTPVVVDIFENDVDIPTSGTISITTPANGTVEITDPNNTPNDPSDDVVTYVPNT